MFSEINQHSWKWWLLVVSTCFASIFCWLLNGKASFIGFWTLPLGVFTYWINLFSFIASMGLLIYYRYILFVVLTLINVSIFLDDYKLYVGETKGTSILSWNVGGKRRFTPDNKNKLMCIFTHINEWKKNHDSSIIFLQEVPQKDAESFEKYLKMQCYWTHYSCTTKNCNGLLLCADDSWSFRLEQHREFLKGSRYGYLQLELLHKETQQRLNAINVHLESLYRTATNFPEIKKRASVWKTIKEQPDISLILGFLGEHANKKREEMDRLYDVLQQLNDPTIIAGDFNTPSSLWLHRRLQKDFIDAHRATGRGFGKTTFRWGFIANRINYLYASPELYWTGATTVDLSATCSDHYPISSWFSLPK
jgi:endonuclease/exonuclease/phosphatase family metal-dependent hydrolase